MLESTTIVLIGLYNFFIYNLWDEIKTPKYAAHPQTLGLQIIEIELFK